MTIGWPHSPEGSGQPAARGSDQLPFTVTIPSEPEPACGWHWPPDVSSPKNRQRTGAWPVCTEALPKA